MKEKKEVRLDRRDSSDEKEQLKNIKQILKKYALENDCILDLSRFEDFSRGKFKSYLKHNGEMQQYAKNKPNMLKGDSKTFDGYAQMITPDKKVIDLIFFCKATKSDGGTQDSIGYEIYAFLEAIRQRNEKSMNSNKEVFILFLEGNYWDTKGEEKFSSIDMPENVFYCNTQNLYATLKKYLA